MIQWDNKQKEFKEIPSMMTETLAGETPETERLQAENATLREKLRQKMNKRLMFRNQVLRELVTPPHRDQQNHLAKAIPGCPIYEATDTQADTVFQRLGVMIRQFLDGGAKVGTLEHDLEGVYQEIRQRAASEKPMTWCKTCGEDIADCRCSIKNPRSV